MTALLEAVGVSVRLGGSTILDAVDLAVRSGEFLVVVGPNGAGKTTLLEVLAGVRTPASGDVRLKQSPLATVPANRRARMLALVGREASFDHSLTVEAVALLGRLPHRLGWGPSAQDRAIVQAALRRLDCAHLLHRRLSSLSDGERQRVHWARAETQEPAVLLLDEATAHLDLRHREASFGRARAFARGGRAVVAVAHDLDLALRHADRIAVLHRGRVVESGEPESVLSTALLTRVFGVDGEVIRTPRGRALVTYGALS